MKTIKLHLQAIARLIGAGKLAAALFVTTYIGIATCSASLLPLSILLVTLLTLSDK